MLAMRWLWDIPLSLGAGWCISLAYVHAYRGFFYSKTFVHTCIITTFLITILVGNMLEAAAARTAIGANLAFALVGLLGLIRFRTVVRDTREFSYILLAIVTGVGIGSDNRALAIIGCVAAIMTLAVLEWSDFGAPRSLSLRLRIRGRDEAWPQYEAAVAVLSRQADLVSARQLPDGVMVLVYDLVANAGESLVAVSRRLQVIPGTIEVSAQRWSRGNAADKDDG